MGKEIYTFEEYPYKEFILKTDDIPHYSDCDEGENCTCGIDKETQEDCYKELERNNHI